MPGPQTLLFLRTSLTTNTGPLCIPILTRTISAGILLLLYLASLVCNSTASLRGSSGPCRKPIAIPSPVGSTMRVSFGAELNDTQLIILLFRTSIFLIWIIVDIDGSERPTISMKKKLAWTKLGPAASINVSSFLHDADYYRHCIHLCYDCLIPPTANFEKCCVCKIYPHCSGPSKAGSRSGNLPSSHFFSTSYHCHVQQGSY